MLDHVICDCMFYIFTLQMIGHLPQCPKYQVDRGKVYSLLNPWNTCLIAQLIPALLTKKDDIKRHHTDDLSDFKTVAQAANYFLKSKFTLIAM